MSGRAATARGLPRPRDAHAHRHRQLRRRARSSTRSTAREWTTLHASRSPSPRAAATRCATGPPTAPATRPRLADRSRSPWSRARPACRRARTSSPARSTPRRGTTATRPRRRRREGARASPAATSCCRSARTRSTSRARARSACSASRCRRGLHAGRQALARPGSTATSAAQGSTYAQVGLKLFQTNDNWIKVAHNRNADSNPTGLGAHVLRARRTETNGTRTLGTRTGLGTGRTCRRGGCGSSGPARRSRRRTRSPIPYGGAGANWVELGVGEPRHAPARRGRAALHRRLRRQRLDHRSLDYVRFTPDSPERRRAAGELALARRRRTARPAGTARRSTWPLHGRPTTASASRASRAPSTASAAARSRPTPRRSRRGRRHAHGRVPLHRQGGQRRDGEVGHGQARRHGAGDDRDHDPVARRPAPGPGDAHVWTATDATSGVALTEYRVNGWPRSPALARRRGSPPPRSG